MEVLPLTNAQDVKTNRYMKPEDSIEAAAHPNTPKPTAWVDLTTPCGRTLPLLLVVLVLTLSPAVEAQFNYTTNGGTITITEYTGSGGALTIPDTIDGLPVVRIGSRAFYARSSLTSATIPSSVTNIENWAFDFVVGAFAGSTNLTAIHVDSLNSVYSSIDGVLFNKRATTLLTCPAGKAGDYAVPSSVTHIVDGAFSGCRSLSTVTISNRVTRIGDRAFAGCSRLITLTIPRIPRIGDGMFSGCSRLTSITISNGVTRIGDGAFSGCSSLTNVAIPSSVTSIGGWAFSGCSSLTSITFSNRITLIGNRAFLGCRNLNAINVDARNPAYSSVDGVLFDKNQTTLIAFPGGRTGSHTIPNTVTDIEDGAFAGCDKLTRVAIPETITRIADGAFSDCHALTALTIPTSVIRIGYRAFSDCSGLSRMTIPGSVAQIGDGAFYGCSDLEGLYFEGNAPGSTSGSSSLAFLDPVPTTMYHLPETTGWVSLLGGPRTLWQPRAETGGADFGVQANRFGFTISWASARVVVVEASTDLNDLIWSPVSTNVLTGGASYFSDPEWIQDPARPARFYRLRSP